MAKMVPSRVPENRPKSERKMFQILQKDLHDSYTVSCSLTHIFFREDNFLEQEGFKGLEAEIVILYDIDENDPLEEYVAMSRAKHMLYIVHHRRREKPQERQHGN